MPNRARLAGDAERSRVRGSQEDVATMPCFVARYGSAYKRIVVSRIDFDDVEAAGPLSFFAKFPLQSLPAKFRRRIWSRTQRLCGHVDT